MMIYNDSTTGVNISVNMPRVTPEMIALADKAPGKRLVIEWVDPTALAAAGFKCESCGREESQCSAEPCEAVIADRAA